MKRPLFTVCLAVVAILAMCMMLRPPSVSSHDEYDGRQMLLSGRVDKKEYRTSLGKRQLLLYLTDVKIFGNSEFQNSKNQVIKSKLSHLKLNGVLCYVTEGKTEPRMGSTVCVRGRLEDFDTATNPGQFDSRLHYAVQGMDMRLQNGELLEESDGYNVLRERLWRLRILAGRKLERFLYQRDASVMKTMLLGDKETLDGELKRLFQRNGIAHILAISGLHISLAGLGAYKLLRKIGIPVRVSALLCIILIVLYGLFTGAGVSAYRAAGMFLLRMLAEIVGRTYDMQTALGVLLLLMVLQQPLYLLHSGFLLSFSSLLGIGCLYPALEQGRREQRRYRSGFAKALYGFGQKWRKALWAGVAVTVATMPVNLWYFFELPLYSVLLNLLVIPLMTVLMYAGLGLLCLPIGAWLKVPALLVHGILSLYESLCQMAERLPKNILIVGRPEMWQIGIFVMLMLTIILGKNGLLFGHFKLPRKWRIGILILAVCLLCIRADRGVQVTFLDVGQGDSICIQTENGQAYLVDCGSSGQGVGQYRIAPFLKHQGIAYIDALVITHPDADHCNGLQELLENGYGERVGRLLLPDIAEQGKNKDYRELEQIAISHSIQVSYLSAGMSWQDGDMEFQCLHRITVTM